PVYGGGVHTPDRGSSEGEMPAPTAITYVGHSSVLIEIDGVRLLTDPMLRRRVLRLRRLTRVPPTASLLPLDAVLVSHAHHDHLDLPSLTRLGRDSTIVAAASCAPALRRRGFADVTPVVAGDSV